MANKIKESTKKFANNLRENNHIEFDENVKFDGSFQEMLDLGLVDEVGTVIDRERHNVYMSRYWESQHQDESKEFVDREEELLNKPGLIDSFSNGIKKLKAMFARKNARNAMRQKNAKEM